MHLSKLEKEDVMQKAFQQLDRDNSGTISLDELSTALKQFNVRVLSATLYAPIAPLQWRKPHQKLAAPLRCPLPCPKTGVR
jgi:hypothetical protein